MDLQYTTSFSLIPFLDNLGGQGRMSKLFCTKVFLVCARIR